MNDEDEEYSPPPWGDVGEGGIVADHPALLQHVDDQQIQYTLIQFF
jgi:hypothetical protein